MKIIIKNMTEGTDMNTFFQHLNKEVLKIIHTYLTPKETERKLNGEVFTPLSVIYEKMNTLPKKKWENKNLKWLDPANGIGNYTVIVYYKLMEGLKNIIKNEKDRSKHIIEKMIYMNEINVNNNKIARHIFKMIDSEAEPNIQQSDFLKDFKPFNDGTNTFDIIIGNPPYNSGGIKAITTDKIKRDQTKCKTIWANFIRISFELLKNSNSYLLFLFPASWIRLKSSNAKLITSKQIVYLRYYSCKQAGRLFNKPLGGGTSPLTYCLIKNEETQNDTKIYDNCNKKDVMFNIYKNNFVPTESVNMFRKIYDFTKKYGNLENKFVQTKDNKNSVPKFDINYPFPVINIKRKEIIVKYTNINNDFNNDKKLILSNSSMGYPLYDKDGILYPSSQHHFIIYSNNNEKELKQLQNYFFTPLIFYIITIIKTSQKFLDTKIFEILPDITKITDKLNITNDYLIRLFNLTDEDLVCLETYKKKGEGRLPNEKITEMKKFSIENYGDLNENKIKYIQEMKIQSPRKRIIRKRKIRYSRKLYKKDIKNHSKKNKK